MFKSIRCNSSRGGQGVLVAERGVLHFNERYEMFMSNAAGFDAG